jgi:hypothetical protein
VTSVLRFNSPYLPAQPFFTGAPSTNLVPDIFPIAINGREYMVDQKANTFTRGFEPRVRDSVDQSTTPGEAAINPQGLWRRGESSWHLGSGQKYADTADAQDYRFYTSQGVNPWTKGQLTLLKGVAESLDSANTNLMLAETDTRVYVVDGQDLKYSTDPFASSPTWNTASGLPASLTPRDIASDGKNVYLTYPGTTSDYGLWKYTSADEASNVAYGHEFANIDLVKGYFIVTGTGSRWHGSCTTTQPETLPILTTNIQYLAGSGSVLLLGLTLFTLLGLLATGELFTS